MEIVTGSTGVAHVTAIDDAICHTNLAYLDETEHPGKTKVVFDVGDKFSIVDRTANLMRINSGYGMSQGRLFKINGYEEITIDNGTAGVKRADLIVARYTMNTQTGVESMTLTVLKGQEGTSYVDPVPQSATINTTSPSGNVVDDFPLYRVKLNGLNLDGKPEALFTPLPDGGVVGEIENMVHNVENALTAHKNNNDPHRIQFSNTILDNYQLVSKEALSTAFHKIASGLNKLAAHIANTSNPHQVTTTQLIGILPISKGGTGATTAAEALQNLGVPSTVAQSATKTYVDNGVSSAKTYADNKVNAAKQELQASFQDGVDTIADELTARKGPLVIESATSSTPTPYDVAHNINMMMYELYMHGMSYVADNNGDSSAGEGTGIADLTDGHGNSYYEITEGDIMNLMRLIAESNYSAGRNA